jgi:hypothetical protein
MGGTNSSSLLLYSMLLPLHVLQASILSGRAMALFVAAFESAYVVYAHAGLLPSVEPRYAFAALQADVKYIR